MSKIGLERVLRQKALQHQLLGFEIEALRRTLYGEGTDSLRPEVDLDALGVELDAVAPCADALIQAATALVDLLKAKKSMARTADQSAAVVFPDAAPLYAEIRRYAGMPAGATPDVLRALDAYWSARADRAFNAARAASPAIAPGNSERSQ
ncbi:hypothetical protein [Metapseudomonas sp. CR1201]